MVGGVRFARKFCRAPYQGQKAMCCDSVAMRAVSSDQQLKSLRDERWREPLRPWEREQKNGPIPAPGHGMVGGVAVQPEKFAGAPYQASEGNVLRQRCDARGFTPPPIEILARRKVAPAFEPQKLLSVDGPPRLHRNPHDEGLAKIRQIRGRETGPPSRACNLLFGNLVDQTCHFSPPWTASWPTPRTKLATPRSGPQTMGSSPHCRLGLAASSCGVA
jgi:hypothetical protein